MYSRTSVRKASRVTALPSPSNGEKSRVKYSRREDLVLSLLTRAGSKGVTSADAVDALWDDAPDMPYHTRVIAAGILRSIQKKVAINNEPFRIIRIGSGRTGSVWRIKRVR